MRKFILLGFILILLPFVAHAQESGDFGISVACVGGCENRNISKDILLEFTIKNNFDYWISFGEDDRDDVYSGLSISLEVYHPKLDDGKGGEYYRDILGPGYFIKPKDELKVYLPFYIYNDMDEDSRQGEWEITPELSLGSVSIDYYSPDFSEIDRGSGGVTIERSVSGPQIAFTVTKPGVEVEKEKNISIPNWAVEYGKEIIVMVIATVIAGIILSRR